MLGGPTGRCPLSFLFALPSFASTSSPIRSPISSFPLPPLTPLLDAFNHTCAQLFLPFLLFVSFANTNSPLRLFSKAMKISFVILVRLSLSLRLPCVQLPFSRAILSLNRSWKGELKIVPVENFTRAEFVRSFRHRAVNYLSEKIQVRVDIDFC